MGESSVGIAGFESDFGNWSGEVYDPAGYASVTDDPREDLPTSRFTGLDPMDYYLTDSAPVDELDPAAIARVSSVADLRKFEQGMEAGFRDGGNSGAQAEILDARDAWAAGTSAGRGVVVANNDSTLGASGVNRNPTPDKPPSTVNTTGGVTGWLSATLRSIGSAASGIASAATTRNTNQAGDRSKPSAQVLSQVRETAGAQPSALVPLAAVGLLAYLALR